MKRLFTLLGLFVALLPLMAQTDDGELVISSHSIGTVKKNVFFVGPKIGATFTSMSQPDEGNLYDGMGVGFSGGLAAKLRLGQASENSYGGTGIFGIGLELKYKQNKAKTTGSDDLSIGYFEVPVTAQLYPFYKSRGLNTLYIEFGIDMALGLSSSPEELSFSPDNGVYNQVKYATGDLKASDFRIPIGIGYTIPKTGLDINLRYYIGTSKLAENFSSKMNSLELSLAWLFKAGGF
ncbi:MAG: outer membrane beta-barrel protein [Bacteroidaceae bacterium]|nr:outer membrane beta-barrel protein [Bacteroidaceae bacterium]